MPSQDDRWIYQIGDERPAIDLCVPPQGGGPCVRPTVWVLDLYAEDGVTPNRSGVDLVHRNGGRAVCYVSGGSWEQWRPDAARFPKRLRGKPLDGWAGERWLDIRQSKVLEPLIRSRAKKCRGAGFDAIDWDNVDGFTQQSGFPISGNHQLAYNRLLAKTTHEMGLAVGLKNDLSQVVLLAPVFDFLVNEQCHQFDECVLLRAFERKQKAVVQIEYVQQLDAICPTANAAGRFAMVMGTALNARTWKPCR